MTRPIRLFCHKLGRELGMDPDIIMTWSLSKIYENMAYYVTESDKFREDYKSQQLTPKQKMSQLAQFLKMGIDKK